VGHLCRRRRPALLQGPSAGSGGLIQRAASMGVRVNETMRLTAMAAAEVRPNEDHEAPYNAGHEAHWDKHG